MYTALFAWIFFCFRSVFNKMLLLTIFPLNPLTRDDPKYVKSCLRFLAIYFQSFSTAMWLQIHLKFDTHIRGHSEPTKWMGYRSKGQVQNFGDSARMAGSRSLHHGGIVFESSGWWRRQHGVQLMTAHWRVISWWHPGRQKVSRLLKLRFYGEGLSM